MLVKAVIQTPKIALDPPDCQWPFHEMLMSKLNLPECCGQFSKSYVCLEHRGCLKFGTKASQVVRETLCGNKTGSG
jgi:hypothetical protein